MLGTDVIWTAEYAAQGWLLDVSDFISRTATVHPVDRGHHGVRGQELGRPVQLQRGFIYYRTDEVDQAPETWEDLYKEAREGQRRRLPGLPLRGLTVNFLELVYSAGGSVLSEDGKEATADSQEVKDALAFMATASRTAAPKAVTTYKEEESRRAFESGNATFMRNWPYAYALGKDSKIADNFDISTFPGYAGNEGAGVLGGYNLASRPTRRTPRARSRSPSSPPSRSSRS